MLFAVSLFKIQLIFDGCVCFFLLDGFFCFIASELESTALSMARAIKIDQSMSKSITSLTEADLQRIIVGDIEAANQLVRRY